MTRCWPLVHWSSLVWRSEILAVGQRNHVADEPIDLVPSMMLTRVAFAWGIAVFIATGLFGQDRRWPDPVANHVIPCQSTSVTHGPILGDATSDSIRVWLRSSEKIRFDVLLQPDRPPFDSPVIATGETNEEEDFTGVVEIGQLKPNTRYAWAVRIDGEIIDPRDQLSDPWPSFQTLPDQTSYAHRFNPEGRFNFSFSIGACQRQRSPGKTYGIYSNPPAFDTIWNQHRDKLRFHIVNGDYTYEETLSGDAAGIQSNYKLYLDRGRSLNRLLHWVPMLTMYNDHEVTDNIDGAGEVGLGAGGHLVRDPALRIWQYYADWANGDAPHKAAIRMGQASLIKGSSILHDPEADFSNLNLAQVSTLHMGPFYKGGEQTTKSSPNAGVYRISKVVDKTHLAITPPAKRDGATNYSIGTHHYFDRKVGNCHFLFIDTRGERTQFRGVKQASDPDRFVLGNAQKKWFVETVQSTNADFIFVISPDPWFVYHSNYHMKGESTSSKGDGYCGYVHERNELTRMLDAIEKPVLLFTGDVHHPVAAQITDNVWEFLISPVNSANHPIGTAGLPPLGGWFDSEGATIKIKWLGGYPDNVHYLRQRNTVYGVVQLNNIIQAGRKEGPGYQYIAYDEPQVIVRFHDGYSGDLLYSEAISTLDAKPPSAPAKKENRFGHWNK